VFPDLILHLLVQSSCVCILWEVRNSLVPYIFFQRFHFLDTFTIFIRLKKREMKWKTIEGRKTSTTYFVFFLFSCEATFFVLSFFSFKVENTLKHYRTNNVLTFEDGMFKNYHNQRSNLCEYCMKNNNNTQEINEYVTF